MKYIFKYKNKSEVVANHVDDTIALLYNMSYPEVDFMKDIIPKCKQIREEYKGDNPNNAFYLTGKDGKKYLYPLDFYYCPAEFQSMIVDNFCDAFGITTVWESHVDALLQYINNVDNACITEVYEKDDNGFYSRSYKHLPSLKDALKEIIKDDNVLDEVYNTIEDYIDKAKHFYRFGLREENQFRGGVVFHSPNSNRDTVKAAWKEVFDKDIDIPDDSEWGDEYQLEEEEND